MSRGPGRIQREVARLIAQAKPSDAWTFEEIGASVYGTDAPTRWQIGSVDRAIKRMHLPGTWRTGRAWGRDRRWWLYDPRRLASDPRHRCPLAEVELVDIETLVVELPG
jgi:hypothetical protein